MIRRLTISDWKLLVEEAGLGVLNEIIPINHANANEPETDFEFSDAKTQINVELTNPETHNTLPVSFIFSSYGLVNVMVNNNSIQDEENDINLYYIFPEALEINACFYGIMTGTLGTQYSDKMITKVYSRILHANRVKNEMK